jgi:hypothetical protein
MRTTENEMKTLYPTIVATLLLSMTVIVSPAIAADEIAPPGEDETLIYVLREKRFTGGGNKMWIAVNDQTVARVKNKGYAVVRAPAGRITLNLATSGIPSASIELDDRPGETVYLRWRLPELEFREVDEEDGLQFVRKAKQTAPIEAPKPNNEELRVLINLSRLGFDLMQPAAERLEPDEEHAVLTIFRNHEKKTMIAGIFGEDGFTATLEADRGIDVRLPPGEHFFITGSIGTSVFTANVEAGRRYYARLDIGSRNQLKPISPADAGKLEKWINDVEFIELNPDAVTDRVREREEIVSAGLEAMIENMRNGKRLGNVLEAGQSFD